MLTVITFSRGDRPKVLQNCVDSVQRTLPPKARHLVFETTSPEALKQKKIEILRDYENFCFVDEDDTVVAGALAKVVPHMHTGIGVLCTDENLVHPDGRVTTSSRLKTYEAIRLSPREVHHLCVISSYALPKDLEARLEDAPPFAVDWLIKASAALTLGAVHLPLVGYNWTVTTASSQATDTRKEFSTYSSTVTRYLNTLYPARKGRVPTI